MTRRCHDCVCPSAGDRPRVRQTAIETDGRVSHAVTQSLAHAVTQSFVRSSSIHPTARLIGARPRRVLARARDALRFIHSFIHDADAAQSANLDDDDAQSAIVARREAASGGRWTSTRPRAVGARARRRSNVARARGANVRALRVVGARAGVSRRA